MGFPIDSTTVSYYSPSSEMFVFCGHVPLPKDTIIFYDDFFE